MMNFEIISMRFPPVSAKRSGHLPFLLLCPRSFLFVRGWWSAFYLFTTRNFFVRLRRERRTTMMEKECPENCVGNHIISLPTPTMHPPCWSCPRKKTNCPPDGQLLSLLPPVRSRAYVFGYRIVQSFTRDISRVASFRKAREPTPKRRNGIFISYLFLHDDLFTQANKNFGFAQPGTRAP